MSNMNKTEAILPLYTTTTFRQQVGETLKDTWERINKIHSKEHTPCAEENMNLFFYYGLDPWCKNALDRATGGSYVLYSPTGLAMALKNIFWHP